MNLYDRYNHKCAYCGSDLEYKDMQVDHIKPVKFYYETIKNNHKDGVENA